jgi:exonuclease III
MRRIFQFSFFLFASFFLSPVNHANSQSMDVKVMTFNVWSADSQTDKLAEIIQAGGADVVGLQEMNNGDGQALANQLGWHYHQQSGGDIQVVSRHAIVGQSSDNRGVRFEFSPGHEAWLFNAHFVPYPYQPYDLRDNPSLTESQLINSAESTRGGQFDSYLSSISSAAGPQDSVFFVGDFNEPSHLDWTQQAADSTARPFDKQVRWPGSEKVLDAGFADSFRTARPDEVNDRGYTWTPGYPPPNLSPNEVHDRIDIVYSRGSQVSVLNSQTVGLDAGNPNTDIAVSGYNSDHRAVVSEFRIDQLDHSSLTFSRLQHNPGDDSALNAGNYGDRLTPTPNVTVEFLASSGAHWDTYDGDQDGGQNNWNVGVAQLQSSFGGVFDLVLAADEGYGVVLDSFDLVDYVNFASGHTVEWQLWSGEAELGILLNSGILNIEANGIESVTTGLDEDQQQLTLRLLHLSGDGTDLALDNVVFQQFVAVPEPQTILFFYLLVGLAGLGRRRV